jgi:Avidin family
MSWIGMWKNQYGSVVEITDDSNGQIRGTFRTVLDDSSFHGKTGAHIRRRAR